MQQNPLSAYGVIRKNDRETCKYHLKSVIYWLTFMWLLTEIIGTVHKITMLHGFSEMIGYLSVDEDDMVSIIVPMMVIQEDTAYRR